MQELIAHPLVWSIIDSLVWGPPYWPETGVFLAAVTLALWLGLRVSRRRKAVVAQLAAPPPPPPAKVEPEEEDIYDAARRPPRRVAEEITPPETTPPPPVEEKAVVEETPPTAPVEEVAEPVEEAPPHIVEEPPVEDFLTRLKRGLKQTQQNFLGRIDSLVRGARLGGKIDEELYEELEEALVTADLGVDTAYKLLEKIQKQGDRGELKSAEATRELLRTEILKILERVEAPLNTGDAKPFIILVLGVNGVGKTTTIAKLAYRYRLEGKKVLLAAGDTFRAAAIEQLDIWAGRVGTDIVKHAHGSDPSAVAYDAMQAAIARNIDVVIVDTAGRLHTRVPLMEELKKVKRIIGREMEQAPHETLLVLDSTTGQNAISQAQSFHEALGVTGIAITKLDGTAKGGVIVGVSDKFKIPIRFIGIGEKMHDLVDFQAKPFIEALFSQ